MTDILDTLAARIRRELADIERVAGLAERRCKKALLDADYLGSVALDLHGFYQGVERLLELVAKTLDGALPSGEDWRRQLLKQMSSEVATVRPAVVSAETKACLGRLRRFRHVARNVYAFNLVPDKLEPLLLDLPRTARRVHRDLEAFAVFLERAASGPGSP